MRPREASGPGERHSRRVLVVSHPAVVQVNQLPYVELARRGWHVEIVTPKRWKHEYAERPFSPAALPELTGSFTRRRVLLAGHPQRHFYITNPVAAIRRSNPDVVFCEQEPFSAAGTQWGLAAHMTGVPYGLQLAENLDRRLPLPARAMMAAVLPRAAFVAARSDTARVLAHRWGARGNVMLVPHHVPGWPPGRPVRHEAFTVGFAGRLVPEKGLDTLAAAIRGLDHPVDLLAVGDGPLRDWLQSANIGEARLRHVRRASHDEMVTYYRQMDVLVLPSRTTPTWTEQFGRVLVEALWCGVPVIGSDSGEIPWVIETTGGGLVFPEDDAKALAIAVERLRLDDELRSQLASRGQQKALDVFSIGATTDRLEEALTSAIWWRRGGRR